MAVNGIHPQTSNGLPGAQNTKLLQKELDLTKERLQKEKTFGSQTRAELLLTRTQLRTSRAQNDGLSRIHLLEMKNDSSCASVDLTFSPSAPLPSLRFVA